jgi:hypothetical protein
MRGGGGRDIFVVVSYDFEYSTEEGKRVWMKEGEVLLLLAKTNNDWWQVWIPSPSLCAPTRCTSAFFSNVSMSIGCIHSKISPAKCIL